MHRTKPTLACRRSEEKRGETGAGRGVLPGRLRAGKRRGSTVAQQSASGAPSHIDSVVGAFVATSAIIARTVFVAPFLALRRDGVERLAELEARTAVLRPYGVLFLIAVCIALTLFLSINSEELDFYTLSHLSRNWRGSEDLYDLLVPSLAPPFLCFVLGHLLLRLTPGAERIPTSALAHAVAFPVWWTVITFSAFVLVGPYFPPVMGFAQWLVWLPIVGPTVFLLLAGWQFGRQLQSRRSGPSGLQNMFRQAWSCLVFVACGWLTVVGAAQLAQLPAANPRQPGMVPMPITCTWSTSLKGLVCSGVIENGGRAQLMGNLERAELFVEYKGAPGPESAQWFFKSDAGEVKQLYPGITDGQFWKWDRNEQSVLSFVIPAHALCERLARYQGDAPLNGIALTWQRGYSVSRFRQRTEPQGSDFDRSRTFELVDGYASLLAIRGACAS